MDAIVARQDNHHKTLQTERLRFSDPGPVFHTIMSTKNDGHYFCVVGGNRPDDLNEPVTYNRLVKKDPVTGEQSLRMCMSRPPFYVQKREFAGRKYAFRPEKQYLLDAIWPVLVSFSDVGVNDG